MTLRDKDFIIRHAKRNKQYDIINFAFDFFIDRGVKDKVVLYDKVQMTFGYPRPSIRKIKAYILKNTYKEIRILELKTGARKQRDIVQEIIKEYKKDGITDKKKIYDKIEKEYGLPRPTIRRIYGSLQ